MIKSGLGVKVLEDIWNEVDHQPPRGSLTRHEFLSACKLIAVAQTKVAAPTLDNLRVKASVPTFKVARAPSLVVDAEPVSTPEAKPVPEPDRTAGIGHQQEADQQQKQARATVLEQMAETMFTLFKVDHKSGTLSGAQLQPVFAKCEPKVATAMLRKIWSAASDGAAALDHAKVVKMLGFIGQAQAGATPNPSAYLSAPPPTIAGLPIPKETAAAAVAMETAVDMDGCNGTRVLDQMANSLFRMFKKNPAADELSGAQLQPVFTKCDPQGLCNPFSCTFIAHFVPHFKPVLRPSRALLRARWAPSYGLVRVRYC